MSGEGKASGRQGRILMVDDTPDNRRLLMATLTEQGYTVHAATSGREALRFVETTRPDLVLLAVYLPGMDGYAVCERLKADRRLRDIPVIFLSAADRAFDKVRAFAAGGVDYLAEPFQAEEALARIDTHLSLRQLRVEMEGRVRARTSELVEANARLVQEAAERTRAEEAAARTHRRFEALVHSIDGIVWEADAETFHFSFVSQQAERILGYPIRQWLDEPDFWAAHLHPDDREQAVNYCVEATRRGEDHQFEYRMVAADGRVVWMRDIVSVELMGGEKGRLRGIMVDITERKHLEEQFRQAQKMEAVGQLAGGVAHDFNNLLTVINGYSALVFKNLRPNDPAREWIAEIIAAGERAASLTCQLLAFSRKQVLQPQVTDLNQLVAEMAKMLRRLIGEDIDLVFAPAPGLGLIKIDPRQFEQVLMNLAVNARDAMPLGGRLTIETQNCELDAAYAQTLPEVKPGCYILLAVTDTGHGMDESIRPHIFEPFFTTKGVGQGTGLGLSVVHGIVRQSGGHIEVYSEVGRGTSFRIYMPVAEGASLPGAETPSSPEIPQGKETVLLVDDDDSVRGLARTVLQSSGYTVLEARNGDDALRLARKYAGPIHLLLTDVVMPVMGGLPLASRLAAERPDIKTLFVSGYPMNAADGLPHDGKNYLPKPFTPSALAHKVREILGGTESGA